MVKIEFYEEPRESYGEFDTMMAVASGRQQLMKGKNVNTGIRNTITLFVEALILFVMADLYRLFLPGADPLFSKVLVGVGFLLVALNCLLLGFSYRGYKENLKLGQLKADLIFDETGIHAWETEQKGFDFPWGMVTHCFISRQRIYILFTDRRLIATVPYSKDHRDKMIQAMMIGRKLELIKFIDVKKGVISVRNK